MMTGRVLARERERERERNGLIDSQEGDLPLYTAAAKRGVLCEAGSL